MSDLCPCGSSKHYSKCCGRFLDQGQSAKTPEQLMRSRFTAYTRGGYGNYLYETWHSSTKDTLSPEILNKSEHEWLALEVIDKSQKGNVGTVEFKAHYSLSADKLSYLHERSSFMRESGMWFYVSGDIYE